MSHFGTRSQSVNLDTNFNSGNSPLGRARSEELAQAGCRLGANGSKAEGLGEPKMGSVRRSKVTKANCCLNDAGSSGAVGRRKVAKRDDARFLRQEELIRRGLEKALARRRVGLRVSELCQEANIARQTFYAHYQDCDEALTQYELTLEEEFVRMLPRGVRRDLAWTLLLHFVSRHHKYFLSTFRSRDLYLLTRLISYVCSSERNLTSQRAYIIYVGSVEAMILCWGEQDRFATEKMEKYRRKLMLLRVMDYGL